MAGLFDVAGKGTVAGARVALSLDRIGAYRHQLAAGIDYRDFRNRVTFGGGASLVPDYTVHPLSVAYSGEIGTTTFALTAVHGFPGGSRSDDATLAQARLGADAHYLLWRFNASHAEPVGSGWLVRAAVSGQQARNPLVPGEQFGLGGAQSVRGFDERQIAGDTGTRVGLELHGPGQVLGGAEVKPLAFVDYGELRRNQAQPGELAREAIASWGIGARMQLPRQFALSVDAARVQHGTASQAAGRGRLHVALQVNF